MNWINTFENVNIMPLGSYHVLIGMDWLDAHHVILDCYNKTFTCLDEEGKQEMVKGIPRPISIQKISSLQLKKCFRKGCKLYVGHAEDTIECKTPSIKYFSVLQEFVVVFQEVPKERY